MTTVVNNAPRLRTIDVLNALARRGRRWRERLAKQAQEQDNAQEREQGQCPA